MEWKIRQSCDLRKLLGLSMMFHLGLIWMSCVVHIVLVYLCTLYYLDVLCTSDVHDILKCNYVVEDGWVL